jgi:predicted nucleic acid-binding protein
MLRNRMKHNATIIVDTSFWIALFNPRDADHATASNKAFILNQARLIFPWPMLYETLNTRLVKNRSGIARINALIKGPNTVLFDDVEYRRFALQATMHESQTTRVRAISLVDMIIRFVIDDPNVRIAALLTFNEADFSDVCRRRQVEIL